jgi:hypothetical protein
MIRLDNDSKLIAEKLQIKALLWLQNNHEKEIVNAEKI